MTHKPSQCAQIGNECLYTGRHTGIIHVTYQEEKGAGGGVGAWKWQRGERQERERENVPHIFDILLNKSGQKVTKKKVKHH